MPAVRLPFIVTLAVETLWMTVRIDAKVRKCGSIFNFGWDYQMGVLMD